MSKSAKARKDAQRERDRTLNIKRVEIRLNEKALKDLDSACVIRGGRLGKYTAAEYIETLIEQDQHRLELQLHQLKEAGPCKACGKPLPEGCGAEFQEEASCFHRVEFRQLMLSEPVRMPPLTQAEFDAVMADQ